MPVEACTWPGCEKQTTYARHLCKSHYNVDLEERKQRMANGETGDVSTTTENLFPDGEADTGSAVLGNEQSNGPVSESPYLSPTTPGEQRPGAGVGTPSSPSRGAAGGETRPQAPESKVKKWWKGREKTSAPGDGTPPPTTRERRPATGKGGRRESGAETISDAWSALGSMAIRTGSHAPLGRCMQWQAPVAGEMLDEAIKGSIVDKMALQRVVKGRQRFDVLGAVFGPPLLVLAIERNPQNAQTLMPMLASSIRHSLPLMVPAIKKAKERERKVQEATALLFEDDPDFPKGVDPVEYILQMMFEGWIAPEPPQPEPVPDMYADEPVG